MRPIQLLRKARQRTEKTLKLENLESRDLLAGDVVAGGVLGLRSDIDQSGQVDFADFLALSTTFGQEALPETNGDINADGVVDFHDFNILSANFGESTDIPTSRVQIIHNSPYASAAEVDVYLDGGLLGPLDSFSFRSATPYIDVPAGVEMTIDIAGAGSESSDEAIFSATVSLEAGKNYLAVAAGDPTLTEGDQKFGISLSDIAKFQTGTSADAVDLLVFHGSPDAPAVDIVATDLGGFFADRVLADDISYPQFNEDYVAVVPTKHTIDITPAADNDTIVASFALDVSTIPGKSRVLLASGFLAPPSEADPAFGLLLVEPFGSTSLLPAATDEPAEARLQVVHNSPYAAAATVDVYVNGGLLPALDDFSFREATPYIDVPAGVEVTLDITAANAADNSSPVFSTTVTLEDGETYVAVADGDPTQAEGDTAFSVFVSNMGRESAETAGNVELLVFHGAPDAPTVDVIARDVATLVDNISYPEFDADYVSVPAAEYTVDITPGDDNDTVVASFVADLSGAADAAVVVAASGFLAPPSEADPGFGLLAVFPNGDTALLPAAVDEPAEARLQVVHNSPYTAAASVDVYVNGGLLSELDDFDFREATPFLTVPAGVEITLDVTGASAADNSSPVFSKTVVLDEGKTYVAVADGDPTQAEGATAFDVFVTDIGRESATTAGNVELLVFHGSPDAPGVDVIARGVATLVDDIAYPEFDDDYVSVPAGSYTVDITPANDNETVVASFAADLSGAADAALVVAASGFLSPSETDPAFGLLAVFSNGDTALLPAAVDAALAAA